VMMRLSLCLSVSDYETYETQDSKLYLHMCGNMTLDEIAQHCAEELTLGYAIECSGCQRIYYHIFLIYLCFKMHSIDNMGRKQPLHTVILHSVNEFTEIIIIIML
jgi:hypothetical protein